MKTIDLLWKERNCKAGNHKLEISNNGIKNLIYYWTTICKVNPSLKVFATDNGGYNTSSTNRAINAYSRELLWEGYKEVEFNSELLK